MIVLYDSLLFIVNVYLLIIDACRSIQHIIYSICTYLEPICPLILGLNTPNQNKSHVGSRSRFKFEIYYT